MHAFAAQGTSGGSAAGGGITAASGADAGLDTNITQYDSYIYNVWLFPVNKGEALRYLDEGGALPERFAKVIAVRGSYDPPDVMEYKVCASCDPISKPGECKVHTPCMQHAC